MEGFRNCKVFVDIISCDSLSIPVAERVVKAAASTLQMQRLRLRERRVPKVLDSESWYLNLGGLRSCVPFSYTWRHLWLCSLSSLPVWEPSRSLPQLSHLPQKARAQPRSTSTPSLRIALVCSTHAKPQPHNAFYSFSGQRRFSFRGFVTGKSLLHPEIHFFLFFFHFLTSHLVIKSYNHGQPQGKPLPYT